MCIYSWQELRILYSDAVSPGNISWVRKEILEGPTECWCSASGRFPDFDFVLSRVENLKFPNYCKGKLWENKQTNLGYSCLILIQPIELILIFQCFHFAVYCMKVFLQYDPCYNRIPKWEAVLWWKMQITWFSERWNSFNNYSAWFYKPSRL